MKTFHHATLDSPRMRKLLAFMPDAPPGVTPMEIINACATTRPLSDLSELAACGIHHEKHYCGLTESGRKLHRYWLVRQQAKLL